MAKKDDGPDRKRVVLDGTDSTDSSTWWMKSDEEIGPAMVNEARLQENAMEPRREASRRFVQLHKGQLLTHSMLDAADPREVQDDAALAWNVVQAGANTAASVVTRNRVRVTFETTGGDAGLQEAAKAAELLVQGTFAGNKLYEQLDHVWFLDAAVPGLGMLLTEPDVDLNIGIERIIPDELIYNQAEARRGKPRQLFRVTWLSRWDAIARYATDHEGKVDKDKEAAIRSATAYEMPIPNVADKHIPLIPVYTGWFLPSRKGAGDGRRVVAVPGSMPGCTLHVKPWKWPRFPISFLRIEDNIAGIWGIGIAERLSSFQYRLNELNFDISEAARLGSVGKWFYDTGSAVNPDDLTNEHAGVVAYTTTKPTWERLEGIPRDLLEERNTTYAQALKEIGLSEWTVGGVQPANIESGEGLRQLREQEQGRAIPAGQNWESAHVDLAECVVLAACDAYEEAKKSKRKLTIQVSDTEAEGLRELDFEELADILTDPDAVRARPYPTSILPASPAGKFDKLREWRADGTIDEETYAMLSEMPDLQSESNLTLAGVKAVRHRIAEILRNGTKGYEPPDPAMPLKYALKYAQATYLRGLRTKVSEEKLQLLLSWIDDAKDLAGAAPTPVAGPTAANEEAAAQEAAAQQATAETPGAVLPPEAAGAAPLASAPDVGAPQLPPVVG